MCTDVARRVGILAPKKKNSTLNFKNKLKLSNRLFNYLFRFKLGLITSHFRTVFLSIPGVFRCMFGVILMDDPLPAIETDISGTGQCGSLQDALIVRLYCFMHIFKAPCARCSKANP